MNYQNPVLTAGGLNGHIQNYAQQYNVNPTTRLTIEQQNYLNQQQYTNQNDPYTNGATLLSQCSDLVRTRIVQDERYRQADNECEMLIKQYIYGNVIPQILSSQQGRVSFERWENCIKQLKEEYSREEVAMTQSMQMLMSDPVVAARLNELQNQNIQAQKPLEEVAQKPGRKPKTDIERDSNK